MIYNIIYLKNENIIISTKEYSNWQEISKEFGSEYMASLKFENKEKLIEFLASEL